jgi:hypothetical protein
MFTVVGNFVLGGMAFALFWATTSLGAGGKNQMTGARHEAKTLY